MSRSLAIAVTRKMPGWKILLSQIGVPEQEVVWNRLQPEYYAAVIVTIDPSSAERKMLERYLAAGGAILDAGGLLEKSAPGELSRVRLSTIYGSPEEQVFTGARIVDIGRRGNVHREAEHLGRTLYLGARDGGYLAHLPFDPDPLVRSSESRRRMFHTAGGAMPNEVVAAVSKGEIRRIVEQALQWLFARQGLPWLHLWRFPENSRSIFSFRIDSDYGTRRQITALHEIARARDIRMSWFIHVEPQQDMLDLFRSFGGDEFGLHAWRHRTFDSYEANAANIAEADAVLRAAGIEASGFAAPLGRWNNGLGRAIEEHGFDYSSEFALDYDDLPFLPWSHERRSHAMQIPIHPVSIGNFIRVKASDEKMIAYYQSVIDEKLAAMEPIVLYGHPGHEHFAVIETIFGRIAAEKIPNMTMGEYARWWRSRLDARFEATIEKGRIVLKSERRGDTLRLRVIAPDGRMAFPGEDGAHEIDGLDWEPAPAPIPAPADLRRARGFSLRAIRHAIEDFNAVIRQ